MKPGDFLLGVFDFFAVILPGAIATWLAIQYVPSGALHEVVAVGGSASPEWAVPAAFLLSSYVLGHFVFMAGSYLDTTYDQWRRRSKPAASDNTFKAARRLQATLNRELLGGDFTTLKWAKAFIQVKAQHARAEIDRLEADQKFFRSLVVISIALALHFWLHDGALVATIGTLGLSALSYRRYVDRRWRMTELIYATAVIVAAVSPAGSSAVPSAATEE